LDLNCGIDAEKHRLMQCLAQGLLSIIAMYVLVSAILDTHGELRNLLFQIEATRLTDVLACRAFFEEFEKLLTHHSHEEEHFLYHPIEKDRKMRKESFPGYEQHRDQGRRIFELNSLPFEHPSWDAKFLCFRNAFIAHMDEEENTLLPLVEQQLDPSEITNLGNQLLRSRSRTAA
jgi:hypothetical protein